MNRIKLSRKPVAWLRVLGCLCIALTGSSVFLQRPVVAQNPVLPPAVAPAVEPAAGPVISGSNFEGNSSYGLQSNVAVTAAGNWWGHATGPTHTTNPGGQGQRSATTSASRPGSRRPQILDSRYPQRRRRHPLSLSSIRDLRATFLTDYRVRFRYLPETIGGVMPRAPPIPPTPAGKGNGSATTSASRPGWRQPKISDSRCPHNPAHP